MTEHEEEELARLINTGAISPEEVAEIEHEDRRLNDLRKEEYGVEGAAFIVTGQCLADDSDRALIGKVNAVVNSHFAIVNAETATPTDGRGSGEV